jgi:hypothetical protein
MFGDDPGSKFVHATTTCAVPGIYSTLATKLISAASVTGTLGPNLSRSALTQDSLALVEEVQTSTAQHTQ